MSTVEHEHDAAIESHAASSAAAVVLRESADVEAWRHPFLTTDHLLRFRRYSAQVWSFAAEHYRRSSTSPLRCAFAVNMAQSMYKWARLSERYGCDATVYLHPMDGTALSRPEWEEFDGECADLLDAEPFLAAHPNLPVEVPCRTTAMDGAELLMAQHQFNQGHRGPLLKLLAESPGLRHEAITHHAGVYPYFEWARELSGYDCVYAASAPIAAYLSNRPYSIFAVGGDLQHDCGRDTDYGRAMCLAFNAARFIMVSNPHALGHSRRLGFTNGVYMPYPMDDDRYAPGVGHARASWEAQAGRGVFVLTTCRIDSQVKGYGEPMFRTLFEVARQRPEIRFVLLAWGAHAERLRQLTSAADVAKQFLILPPVGKRRLIDYYRSCDVVLDQLVYGYYGATALEAAAVGKPIVMHQRTEHYAPLYENDLAPVVNVRTPDEVAAALKRLTDDSALRAELCKESRAWLVRNHGQQRAMPILMALLRLTADRVPLPPDLDNPLCDEYSAEELNYHAACMTTRAA